MRRSHETKLDELLSVSLEHSHHLRILSDTVEKLALRVATNTEVNVTFAEYRHTLHERFIKTHEQLTEIDDTIEKVQLRLAQVESEWSGWRFASRFLLSIVTVGSSALFAVVTIYHTELWRLFFSLFGATPPHF
jgi:flagellar biosynthesis chaperone FliJ